MESNTLVHNIAIEKVLIDLAANHLAAKSLVKQLGERNPHTNWHTKAVCPALHELKCEVNNIVHDLGEKI